MQLFAYSFSLISLNVQQILHLNTETGQFSITIYYELKSNHWVSVVGVAAGIVIFSIVFFENELLPKEEECLL